MEPLLATGSSPPTWGLSEGGVSGTRHGSRRTMSKLNKRCPSPTPLSEQLRALVPGTEVALQGSMEA